ncbi:hypothetical protein CROQUDRAFT_89999 [Cronartium quercuum f. sp. fusiforme G11]|uniref:Uncharacterized protein n=1 Tax=Cronartium quercuum f. sp. fusiforme G11 TaxID=708437 RepID=A0A9P6NR46_9BASI|nr:hypothetical protein CROQUDRAFT_89999 [Cronartium quercuum f. sp. fusiforme G11]
MAGWAGPGPGPLKSGLPRGRTLKCPPPSVLGDIEPDPTLTVWWLRRQTTPSNDLDHSPSTLVTASNSPSNRTNPQKVDQLLNREFASRKSSWVWEHYKPIVVRVPVKTGDRTMTHQLQVRHQCQLKRKGTDNLCLATLSCCGGTCSLSRHLNHLHGMHDPKADWVQDAQITAEDNLLGCMAHVINLAVKDRLRVFTAKLKPSNIDLLTDNPELAVWTLLEDMGGALGKVHGLGKKYNTGPQFAANI